MTPEEQLAIFEQPADGDQAVLACGHRAPMPADPARRADDWYAAIHCRACGRSREVVSVIYVHEGGA